MELLLSKKTWDFAQWWAREMRSKRLRTRREFFEQEIIVPTGPHKGRWRADTQPCWALLLDAMDTMHAHGWTGVNVTGCTQSGKSLHAFAGQICYDVAELQEDVFVGVPLGDMISWKWNQDLKPIFEASKYRELLPRKGPGSQGGTPKQITFNNGVVLRFWCGGGQDKAAAGATARIFRVTETDGMDEPGVVSREASRIEQWRARTMAFGARAIWSQECTLSTPEGRTWQDHLSGTTSTVECPCVHCGEWVAPMREHFAFDPDAPDEIAARESGCWTCPACGSAIAEPERRAMNLRSRLVHRTEDDGTPARTTMLSFRMTAFNNLFRSAADVAADEWAATRSVNPEDSEKKLCQFVHCMPYVPQVVDHIPIRAETVQRRTSADPRGVCGADTEYLTVGADVGKFLVHWTMIAWSKDGASAIVNYGRIDVPTDDMAEELAITKALRQLEEDVVARGAARADGRQAAVAACWVDSRYKSAVVDQFVREANARAGRPVYLAAVGYGSTRRAFGPDARYYAPGGKAAAFVGEEYHLEQSTRPGRPIVAAVNADYWKNWLHERLRVPDGAAGRMVLFSAPRSEHVAFSKHLVSERLQIKFTPGRGVQRTWVQTSSNNHWLDASYLACAAGHYCGFRLVPHGERRPEKTARIKQIVRTSKPIRTRY